MRRLFISYRREDTQAHADHLCDILTARFGDQSVFMDIDSILGGEDFEKAIAQTLRNCDVMVVLIGRHWLKVEANGQRRLDDPNDWVRREIVEALNRDLLVIPVLVDRASMPAATELPVDLHPFAKREAFVCPAGQNLRKAIIPLIDRLERYFLERQPRQFTTECPHCHKEARVGTTDRFFKCPSCNTDVAILEPIREFVSLTEHNPEKRAQLVAKLQAASDDMENRNYQDALRSYDDILRDSPTVWEAILNKSICVFWLGREDLEHLGDVLRLLDTADRRSQSDSRVAEVRAHIAYNIALLAATKERLGGNVMLSLALFELSRSLTDDMPERDVLITEYCRGCYEDMHDRLMRQLERQKRDFDPARGELSVLFRVNKLSPDRERLKFSAAMLDYKQRRRGANPELAEQLHWIEQELQQLCGDRTYPTIEFRRFGSPYLA